MFNFNYMTEEILLEIQSLRRWEETIWKECEKRFGDEGIKIANRLIEKRREKFAIVMANEMNKQTKENENE